MRFFVPLPRPARSTGPATALGAALASAVIVTILAFPAGAADFAPITDNERALTEVTGHPSAPAVVLFTRGKLDVMDYPKEVSSIFEVEMRIKILSEEGLDYGEISVPHSRFFRLKSFEGRTILPDGTTVPLPENAVFEEASSRSRKTYLTKAAFPAVEVGAILDVRYTMRWDSPLYVEPWQFNREIPVLYSEIVYEVPGDMTVKPWGRQKAGQKMGSDTQPSPRGRQIRLWMENLDPLPDEPLSVPSNELANQIMMVPESIFMSGQKIDLLASWEKACEIFEESYGFFLNKDKEAKKTAQQLTTGAPSTRAAIDTIYAFVRDEIRTISSYGLGVDRDKGVSKVLKDGSGDVVEKALLLQAMLKSLKLKPAPDLLWATNRWDGQPDLTAINPWWFDRALVRVILDGEPLYLDPADDSLAPGHLSPSVEGTTALVFDTKKPEIVELPKASFDESTRSSHVMLRLDEDGRLSGEGTLRLDGHHAWRFLRWKDDPEELVEAWAEWLGENYPGFAVSAVEVEEAIERQEVRVGFSLEQNEDDVLGDEASLVPSRPFGPQTQPLALPPERRLTPTTLNFADTREVVLELRWPEGWTVDVKPDEVNVENSAGLFKTGLAADPAARTLRFTRRFERRQRDLPQRSDYAAIRELYAAAEKVDTQDLVLVLE